MSTTGSQGFVFSADLAVAAIAAMLMLALITAHFGMEKRGSLDSLKGLALQRNAVFIADSMVKNRNEAMPALGSAVFDSEKRRVLSNSLESKLLLGAEQLQGEGFFVSSLSFQMIGKSEATVFSAGESSHCVSLDRLGLIDGKIGRVRVKICES